MLNLFNHFMLCGSYDALFHKSYISASHEAYSSFINGFGTSHTPALFNIIRIILCFSENALFLRTYPHTHSRNQ